MWILPKMFSNVKVMPSLVGPCQQLVAALRVTVIRRFA